MSKKRTNMLLKTIVIWLLLMILAIGNAAVRTTILTPWIGEQIGHIMSTIILCVIIFLVTWFFLLWINPVSARNALCIGLIWFIMTIAFEFMAGHYLFGNSWSKLFADYNIFKGRIWIFVLLTNLLSPRIVFVLRQIK